MNTLNTTGTTKTPSTRSLQRIIEAIGTSDGAGVKLMRSLGGGPGTRLDPFLMLDEFSSDNPDDYNAGFPNHPHRGFETVTYMLDGHMRHEDHLGNQGDLRSGGVQWMTAGRGIIHSEMPQQTQGRMRGFQLWVNLPAKEKMKAAGYRDIQAEEIPVVELSGGGKVKIIAGSLQTEGKLVAGAVTGTSADVLYLDVHLPAGSSFSQQLARDHQAFVYAYESGVKIGEAHNARPLKAHQAGVLSEGEQITVSAGEEDARFLILAGRQLREPIAQYGPFVMNTSEEIEQAIRDYQNGILTAA